MVTSGQNSWATTQRRILSSRWSGISYCGAFVEESRISPNQRTQLTSGAERGWTPLADDPRFWADRA